MEGERLRRGDEEKRWEEGMRIPETPAFIDEKMENVLTLIVDRIIDQEVMKREYLSARTGAGLVVLDDNMREER